MLKESEIRSEIVKLARSFEGLKEYPPRSQRVKFSEWWGIHAAWCQMFVNYLIYKTLSPASVPKSLVSQGQGTEKGTAYTPWAVEWFQRQGLWLDRSKMPKAGDIIYFDWSGANPKAVDHVGIVVQKHKDGTVETIEGNTSSGNWSAGGQVLRCRRNMGVVAGYGQLPIALTHPHYEKDGVNGSLIFSEIPPVPIPKRISPLPDYPKWPAIYFSTGYVGKPLLAWEEKMKQRGWDIIVNGIFDSQEEKIVRYFQSEKNLQIDGIIGPQTWAAAWEFEITN